MAAVSHDLRTPLTSLRLLAEAIEDGVADPRPPRRYLRQMSVHIASLSALVDDLFELSRLEAGEISWSMQRVALDELVEETVEAMRPQAEHGRVRVVAEVDGVGGHGPGGSGEGPARAVQPDPERDPPHARRRQRHGGRRGPTASTVEVEVADTGVGLAARGPRAGVRAVLPGPATRARAAGAGLGLTICRAIVEAHGGRIWFADSAAGTCVRFSLPVAG